MKNKVITPVIMEAYLEVTKLNFWRTKVWKDDIHICHHKCSKYGGTWIAKSRIEHNGLI